MSLNYYFVSGFVCNKRCLVYVSLYFHFFFYYVFYYVFLLRIFTYYYACSFYLHKLLTAPRGAVFPTCMRLCLHLHACRFKPNCFSTANLPSRPSLCAPSPITKPSLHLYTHLLHDIHMSHLLHLPQPSHASHFEKLCTTEGHPSTCVSPFHRR